MKFTAFLFVYLTIILVCYCNIQAENDSTKVYTDTTAINFKRCVMGIQCDPESKRVFLEVSPHILQRLPYDTTNGIVLNQFGANNIWKNAAMKTDSMGTFSMADLLDTLFIHAGKHLKKLAK